MVSFGKTSRARGFITSLLTAVLFCSISTNAAVPHMGEPYKHQHLHAVRGIGGIASRDDSHGSDSTAPLQVTHKGFKNVAYYVSWAIYGRNWPPQNIQSEKITHLFYAFAGINNQTGAAKLSDPSADIQKKFDGDDQNDNSTENLYGNLKQIYLHKKKNRNLKTLLSFGGWNLRTYFAPALATEEGRRTFAQTSVKMLQDFGFDGLDIDWEYPNNTKQAQDLVDTCRLFREELDTYSRNLTGNPHFLLTLAVPAGPEHFEFFDMAGLAPYVDFVNLMGYDYHGSFSTEAGHMANLYKSVDNPKSTNYSTQDAVDYYLAPENGWSKEKLNLGMPIYGRTFADTDGPGSKFKNDTTGSWEGGVYDYKAIVNNATFGPVQHDDSIVASWAYNPETRVMVSFDDVDTVGKKAEYINAQGMGGAMWWELSADKPMNDTDSLIRAVTEHFEQCGGLEQCQNVLDYPCSKYKNLREGMPGQ